MTNALFNRNPKVSTAALSPRTQRHAKAKASFIYGHIFIELLSAIADGAKKLLQVSVRCNIAK